MFVEERPSRLIEVPSRASLRPAFPALLRRRDRARLLLLDDSLRVLLSEPEALRLLAGVAGDMPQPALGRLRRLPEEIERKLRDALRAGNGEASCFITIGPLAMRVRRVYSERGSAIALLVKRLAQRDPLRSAASHYSLSRREAEVLQLMLEGMSGAEIAALLRISQGTVKDYFEHLLRKTSSKNRSEMIAKVLEYLPHEVSPGEYRGAAPRSAGCPMPGRCPFVESTGDSSSQPARRSGG